MEANMADEISIININRDGSSPKDEFLILLSRIVGSSTTPICAGGGIDTTRDVDEFMGTGIEKIVIPILPDLTNLKTVDYAMKKYGKQSIQVSLDFRFDNADYWIGKSNKTMSVRDIFSTIQRYLSNGAGEIVLCDITKDGSRSHLNLMLLSPIKQVFHVPILVSGGAYSLSSFSEAFLSGADGVISGTYFAKRDHSLLQLRSSLASHGVSVRNLG
jgi:cyclase